MSERGAQRLEDVGRNIAQPTAWTEHAACHKMTDLFVLPHMRRGRPARDEVLTNGRRVSKEQAVKIAQAKQVCRLCPVLTECRTWALTSPDPAEGMVAGGLTYDERTATR